MSEQSNTTKALKGVSIQTIITISSGIVEILAFSIMSRLLTKEDFGYYAAVTAISSIFVSFSDAGIGAAIVQRKELSQRYLNNAFTLCLLFGLFGSSLLVVCSGPAATYIANESLKVPLMMISVTLFTGTLSSIGFSIMQRKLQFLYMGVIRVSALISTSIVSIILALYGFGYYAIIAKIILYSIICLIASFIAAKTTFRFAFDFKIYKEILSFGGWLMASSFFRKIAEQIDRLMMANLFSVKTLGIYSRPKEFINTMTGKICDIFDSTLFPISFEYLQYGCHWETHNYL
jgi:O-antigen/teichoic acid export membrane protein